MYSTGCRNVNSFSMFQLSSNEATFRTERLYVNKLNIILVQVQLYSAQISLCACSLDISNITFHALCGCCRS